MAKKNNNTTSIGFEDKIWKAADNLRGNLNASEYEGVVLGLIFLKYISDKFEAKFKELSEDEYDNWRYNYPNIEPTTGYVKNAISDKLDAELQDTLSEEMKKRGLL